MQGHRAMYQLWDVNVTKFPGSHAVTDAGGDVAMRRPAGFTDTPAK